LDFQKGARSWSQANGLKKPTVIRKTLSKEKNPPLG
jgi:hypothetical protein